MSAATRTMRLLMRQLTQPNRGWSRSRRISYLANSHHDASSLSLYTRASTVKKVLITHSPASIILDADALITRGEHEEAWEQNTLSQENIGSCTAAPPMLTLAFKNSLHSWSSSTAAISQVRSAIKSLGVENVDSLLVHVDGHAGQGDKALDYLQPILKDVVATGLAKGYSFESDRLSDAHLSQLIPFMRSAPEPFQLVVPVNLLTLPHALPVLHRATAAGIPVVAKTPLDIVVSGIPFRCVDLPSAGTSDADRANALTQASERFNMAINAAINLELAWEKAVWQRAVQLQSTMPSTPASSRAQTSLIAHMPKRDVAWARTIAGNVAAFLGPHASWLLWQHTQYTSVQPAVLRVNAAVMACSTTRGEYEGDPLLSSTPTGPAPASSSASSTSTDLIALAPKEWVQAYRAAMFETCAALDVLVGDAHTHRVREVHAVLDATFPALHDQSGASLTAKVLAVLLQGGTGISQACTTEPEAWKIPSSTLSSLITSVQGTGAGPSTDTNAAKDKFQGTIQGLADKLKEVLSKPME